jgi:DNA replication and repair protein RecF
LVGPHRDDVGLHLDSMPARTCSSQGEQRSLALALRLAAHQLLTSEWGEAPVLLLDDVFSELDAGRSQALVEHLPAGQAVLTTTSAAGVGLEAQAVLEVDAGRVSAVSGPGRRP